MPAALAIAPLPGAVAVKTTSEPAAPGPTVGSGAERFGQVLRSVWVAAPGGTSGSAPDNAAQGQPAPADPEAAVAATEETAAGLVAATAQAPPEKVAIPHMAASTAKPAHVGKQDHRAAAARSADPGVSTVSPDGVPMPEAVGAPAIVANPAVDPPKAAVPAAPVPLGSASVSVSGDQPMPVRADLGRIGAGGGGTPAQGTAPSQPVKGTASKQKASAEAASARVTVPAQTQAVDVPAAAVIETVRPATVPISPAGVGGRDAASSDGVAAGGVAPSVPAPQRPGSGGQAEAAAADTNAPSQPMPDAGSDVPGKAAVPAPALPNQKPASAATETAGPAASGGDHKVTLRPVEAGADPAKAAVPPGSAQLSVMPTATPVPVSATATPTTAVATPHPAASPAMEQLAPALVTLAKTADGGQQMTVRLHPAELGMVQVRIAQQVSGTTQVEITADNPATLLALQRDQPQLHRALDDAGIAAAGRTVTFHVAQPAQAAAGGNGAALANGHGTNQQASPGRTGAGLADADGSAGGGRGSYAAGERTVYPTRRRSGTAPSAVGATARAAGASYRIGLDITA